MPRNTRKLSELETQLNKKDLEIAKYKQLISSIQGLITINGLKPKEESYIDLLSDLPRDRKAATYQLSTDELAEALGNRLNKDGYKLMITKINDKEAQEAINKAVFKKPEPKEVSEQEHNPREGATSRQLEKLTKPIKKAEEQKTHVDELKEHIEPSDENLKPSTIAKKIKPVRKIPTNINEVIEQEQAQAEERKEKGTKKITPEDLPPEARAIYEANKARSKAAENEKHHGKDGDREYNRLKEKEAIEKGEKPIEGKDCPHCGEVLEAPIIRGYHDICWEAKNKREQGK